MSQLDEKLLERIKDEVAQDRNLHPTDSNIKWEQLHSSTRAELWPEVCRRYAEEVNKTPNADVEEIADEFVKSYPDRDIKTDGYLATGFVYGYKKAQNEISQLKKQLEELTKEIVDTEQKWGDEVVNLKSKLEVKEKPDFEVGKDWTEDFTHENGNYLNRCIECGEQFKGHKRRVICKKCFTPNWVELAKKTPPEDNKCAHAGCWADGEMTGFARCMVKEVFPRDAAIAERDEKMKELEESRAHWQKAYHNSTARERKLEDRIKTLEDRLDNLRNS